MKGPFGGADICAHFNIDPDSWAGISRAERALFRMAYAADVAHVEEEPRGSNRGPEVERVLDMAGVGAPNPWCASIWTAYLMDSGVARENLPEDAASVHGWGRWAKEKGRNRTHPARAYAGLIYHNATTGHLVAIAGVEGDHVRTIEGNSNDEGSREGYEVCRLNRPISQFAMFVDCSGL